MTDPVTRLQIGCTHSPPVIQMTLLHAFFPVDITCSTSFVHLATLLLVRGLPPFQRFPHEPLWLTPGLVPLWSIRRYILGTGLRCALEFSVVEISRVSDPLRRNSVFVIGCQ